MTIILFFLALAIFFTGVIVVGWFLLPKNKTIKVGKKVKLSKACQDHPKGAEGEVTNIYPSGRFIEVLLTNTTESITIEPTDIEPV